MHLLITADTVGGVWTYVRELVSGLCRRDVRVTLVSLGEMPSEKQTGWMDGLPGLDFRSTAFKLEWMQESASDLAASAEYLQSTIREVKPDLLHFNQYYYGALECDVPRLVVAHSDVVSWWHAVHGKEPQDSEWLRGYKQIVCRGLREATAVVAPSRWMLDQVERHYIRPACGSVIYNGRTASLFDPHLPKDGYALSVGRVWDPGKQVLLLSFADSPMPVRIVGPDRNPDSKVYPDGIPAPKKDNVRYHGLQSEQQLCALFARADVYVATSRYEPFGLAPVEAALSRSAIVANDIATFRELWDDAALYFAVNDPKSLTEILNLLDKNVPLRREYAQRAYERARRWFTADRMVEKYLQIYRALITSEALVA